MDVAALAERVRERFPDPVVARGEATVVVEREGLLEALAWLRDQPDLAFGSLSDLSATDWPGRWPRYWVAYQLWSMEHRHRLRVKVGLAQEDPQVPSVTSLFPTANWLEREVYDFFGVIFDGHPDLRRIIMPDDWEGHPLRKDYALGGVGTRYHGAFIPPVEERSE
jgi:NADH-quinone oxidoreductase subunit C